MITNSVNIKIVDTPNEAPTYDKEFKLLEIVNCIVVGKDTESGNPTIDIQLHDQQGNKYLVMATGGLIEMIATAIATKRSIDSEKNIDTVKNSSVH